MDLKKQEWEDAYAEGGNFVFYPDEEIVRSTARFIKKRVGIKDFIVKRNVTNALDLGCGIGRHAKFLDDMEFCAYGIDLSETAIQKGKEWLASMRGGGGELPL